MLKILCLFRRLLYRLVRSYAEDNVAVVLIYFKDCPVVRLISEEKTSVAKYISGVGGLLSLAMGASIITVFEVSYTLTRVTIIVLSRYLGYTVKSSVRK